jgi:hypothetical protein
VSEAFDSLSKELSRLMGMIRRAQDSGNTALAEILSQDAARCLIELADHHTSAPSSVQQQQQIQPENDD